MEDELIETSQAWGALPPPVRASIRKRALLMVEAVATLKSAPDMFSSLLRRYLSMAGKSAKKDIAGVCRSLVESLMEELLCLEERNDKVYSFNLLRWVEPKSDPVRYTGGGKRRSCPFVPIQQDLPYAIDVTR